jgi:ferredoxin--NADP+ reductase
MEAYKKHYIAVIGGSISGSEAANLLAQNGFKVVVFEMNKLPYGKIEDGLPSWHISLRDRQQKEIDKKLNQENIRYVPQVKIGKDISFKDLVENWGFSAIILANGAWQDRALNINGIEKFKNKGLIYQNDFIYWFNHKHEPNFDGNRYSLKDGAAVVGGGLASLDVVKVFMIELVREKLIELFNINSDVFTIEKYGIDKLLEEYNIAFEALKLKGATLVYRRTAADMPLKDPKDDTPENIKKAREISEKLLNKYIEKFKFNFKPLSIPVDFIEEDKQFKGLVLQSVEVREGKIIPIENKTEILSTEMLVSSIGSLPEEIDGLQ